jgi:hypothetical protein
VAHGSVQESIYVCASRGHKQGHPAVIARSSSLAQLLLPHSTVEYDLRVYVGCQRFLPYRQREEVGGKLEQRYGVVLSTGELAGLGFRRLTQNDR